RKIQIAVLQNHWTAAVPRLDDLREPLLAGLWNKEAAIKENGVRAGKAFGRRAIQERGYMFRDRRIGDVRQAELAEERPALFLGPVRQAAKRQKPVERQLQGFFPQDLGLERPAHERSAGPEHRDVRLFRGGVGEQSFLGRRALPADGAALAQRKLRAKL